MEILTVALITVFTFPLTYILYYLFKLILDIRRRAYFIHKFPGREPHPIWGTLHEFPGPGEDGLLFMHERSKEGTHGFGKVFYGPIPAVAFGGPDSVKLILKTSEPKPSTFGGYKFLKRWLGTGLLIAGGPKWARNRRLLTPAFHFDILKPYMQINNQCVDVLLNKWSKLSASGGGQSIEVFRHVCLLTLDIMLRCAFSYESDCQIKGSDHPYVKAVQFLGESVVDRMLKPWQYPDFIYYNLTFRGRQFLKAADFVHSVSEDIIKKRREAFEKHGDAILRSSRYIDFLDILLKATDTNGSNLSDGEIRDEVDTFLFEGHDTTASGISWTLQSLAENPDYQHTCQEEIDALLQGRDSHDILWDDLNKLPFTTQCIKEGLRLHSPVSMISRETTKDMDIDGFHLPANTHVDVHIYILHHHPDVWPDPYEYRPSRFSPENVEKMHPFAFVPFSAGPRNCIGQNFAMHELKVAIARILHRFSIEVDPQRPTRHELGIVMKTENGMYLKLKERVPAPKA